MLFDIKPKRSKKDLYNFDNELNLLLKSFDTQLIVVSGLRRTGKTSLVLTSLEESKKPYIFIDVREGFLSRKELYVLLSKGLNELISSISRFKSLIESLKNLIYGFKGVSISGVGISFDWGKDRLLLSEIFKLINKAGIEANTRVIIVFDEFQRIGGTIELELINAIAHSYDYHENLTFVLTGSEMGLLHRFFENTSSPLYGRPFIEIRTRKFTHDESIDFLEKGFNENNVKISRKELEEVVKELDGIIGWLTYYGYMRLHGIESIKTIKQEAIELAKQVHHS
ncbi:MAG: AAA family ATPase, partial [Thermoprotei archaeon]